MHLVSAVEATVLIHKLHLATALEAAVPEFGQRRCKSALVVRKLCRWVPHVSLDGCHDSTHTVSSVLHAVDLLLEALKQDKARSSQISHHAPISCMVDVFHQKPLLGCPTAWCAEGMAARYGVFRV